MRLGTRGCRGSGLLVLALLISWGSVGIGLNVPGQLNASVFGRANDTLTSRVVNDGQDLYATLSDVTVSTIILNGEEQAAVVDEPTCTICICCAASGALELLQAYL